MKPTFTVFLFGSIWLMATSAQVYDLRTLNTHQISGLDRERTVVFLTLGVFEEHGPYMPAYTDGFAAERHTRDVANALVEDPDGMSSCSHPFPSAATPPTRSERSTPSQVRIPSGPPHCAPYSWTWRISLARTVFVGSLSSTPTGGSGGAARSSRAIDQACDYFHDTYGGIAVNLMKIRDRSLRGITRRASGRIAAGARVLPARLWQRVQPIALSAP